MRDLKGKRLLILGGSALLDIIIDFADKNGISLIAVGNNPSSPLAKLDEYYNIDSTDDEKMKKFIVDKKIDGVYLGSHETVIRHACQYVNELGLPCYCTIEQWDKLQNKKSFKDLCKKFGLPVVPVYQYTPENPCNIDYPVVTKPADGAGSVGISICHNEDELINGYRFACEKSPKHQVIVEKCVNNTGMDVFFQISDNGIEFCQLGDKYPVQLAENAGSVAGARVLPSKFTEEFRRLFEEKTIQMFSSLKLRHGLIWIEVFHDGDDYYFNEVGYRANGSMSFTGIDYLCGINSVAADIYFALTGESLSRGFPSLILKDVPKGKQNVCEYWVASKHGKIGRIEGVDKLREDERVLAVYPKYSAGSVVPHTNGFAQNFCVVHFAYNGVNEMKNVIDYIEKTICLYDDNGDDMILHKSKEFIDGLTQ